MTRSLGPCSATVVTSPGARGGGHPNVAAARQEGRLPRRVDSALGAAVLAFVTVRKRVSHPIRMFLEQPSACCLLRRGQPVPAASNQGVGGS